MAKWQDKQVIEQRIRFGSITHEVYPCTGHNSVAGIVFSSFMGETHVNALVNIATLDPALDPTVQTIGQAVQKRIGMTDCYISGYQNTMQIGIHQSISSGENNTDRAEIINAVDAIVSIPPEVKFVMAIEHGMDPASVGAGNLPPEVKFGLAEIHQLDKEALGVANLSPALIYKSAEMFGLDKVALGVVDLHHKPTPLEAKLEDVLALHEKTSQAKAPGLVVQELLTTPNSILGKLLDDIVSQVNNGTLKLSHANTQRLAAMAEAVSSQEIHPRGLSKEEAKTIESVTKPLQEIHYQQHFEMDESKAAQGLMKDNIRKERIERVMKEEFAKKPYVPEVQESYSKTAGEEYSHAERIVREKERKEGQKGKKGGGVIL